MNPSHQSHRRLIQNKDYRNLKKAADPCDPLNFKFKMLAKDGKKEHKSKKATNLRILDILNEQAQERSVKKAVQHSGKGQGKSTLKGKKIDNKTLLHQFRQHIDDFPVVLRQPKEPEFFNNNTTLSVTKSNNQCESQGRRPGSSIPFQRRRDDDRRKQSFSIGTNELNDPDRPARSKSKSTHKAGHSQLGQEDKENRYSQGRHSLMAQRHSRQRIHHNRSCNDEELLRRSAKSKTPVSRSKILEKRQKNNASCIDYMETKNPGSGEKQKRKRRKSSGNLLTKQMPVKLSKKELKKPKHKKSNSQVQPKKRKSLQKQKQPIYDPRPRRSLNPNEAPTVLRKKKSINLQKESDQDDYEYPISKYINVKKKKITTTNKQRYKSTGGLSKEFCKKIFTDNSLIKSSVQTSKKSSQQYERSYEIPQRITQLDDEGTSVKKKPRQEQLEEYYSFEFDLEEVRRFEKRQALEKYHKQRLRRPLFKQILEQFPELNQQEIQFLASVIFIQRQWRQIRQRRRVNKFRQQSQRNNEPNSSEDNISDLMKQNDLSQKSMETPIQQTIQLGHSRSNPQKNIEHSSSSNSSIKDPLYLALIEHKRKELQKFDEVENNYRSIEVDNPLEKYRDYFKELESADVKSLSKQQSKEEFKTISKPIFKKIKRVSELSNSEDQQTTVKIKIPEKIDDNVADQPLPAHRGNYGVALTERSDHSKSSVNCQRQIFPPLQLISQQKKILLVDFTAKVKTLEQQYVTQQIDTARFKDKKNQIQQDFNKQISQLKTSNKDIEKGYLKYIDFLKKIKLQTRMPKSQKSSSRLRRVSSEDSLMSRLYSRFCSIQSLSNDSSSLKQLKKRLLIRKEYVSNETLGIRRNLSRHQLLSNEKYLQKKDFDMSEKIRIDEEQSFEKIEQLTEQVQEMKKSADFVPAFVLYDEKQVEVNENISGSMININEFLCRIKENEEVQSNGDSDLQSSAKITQNLKKQQNSIYLSEQIFQLLITEFQIDIADSRNLSKKIKNRLQKKKRKLPSINCEISGVTDYIDSLFNFLRQSKYMKEVLINFNTALGYAPYSFLKMLRDPDFLPPEEYIQIIPDAVYIELQKIQLQKLQVSSVDPKFTNFLRGISSVHNRVIFQAVKVELLRLKPYGEEGLPYPWDPQPLFIKKPTPNLQDKFTITKQRILRCCEEKCGLLLEKYNIRTAEDLEKVHQQNEQRLLEALEEDIHQDHSWDFVNMQLLQTKMDLDTELFNLAIDEFLDEIVILKNRSRQF